MKSRFEIIRIYSFMIKKWLYHKVRREKGYDWIKCPVCGHLTMNENCICPYCHWEYDDIVDENEESYVNGSTIREYRMRVVEKYGKEIIKTNKI